MLRKINILLLWVLAALLPACNVDDKINDEVKPVHQTTAYDLKIPGSFTKMPIPADNQLTVEGVKLGRLLFYDPILSMDSTQSCATCHSPAFAFSDNAKQFSKGVLGIDGNMNAMPLINLGWVRSGFFWDGRSKTLEEQALEPIQNKIEMHEDLGNVIKKLQRHRNYPELFKQAFGTKNITPALTAKALSQFERTLISGNSKYDRQDLNASERNGYIIFFDKAHCEHCHGDPRFFTDNEFRNNGLDYAATYSEIPNKGRGIITGKKEDFGKFRTPTLRNIEFTAPYMHDGRFKTLEEVVEHYNSGIKWSPTLDNVMPNFFEDGLELTDQEKKDLIAFLKALSDTEFINNPDFQNPH